MSPPALSRTAGVLREALLEAAWAQWRGIGRWAADGRAARSIVDPEALVLGSLWLESAERRLWRLLRVWARVGARWLSVQRLRNLASAYPESVTERLGAFAWECFNRGSDPRWKAMGKGSKPDAVRKGSELESSPEFHSPAALMLRLRVGLGVGVKADVLAFLLGRASGKHTIGEITVAVGYHRRAVQRAVDELVAAGFLAALATAPASYRAPLQGWGALLDFGQNPPPWWYWNHLYAFGAALDMAATDTAGKSLYLQSSRGRDVVEQHRAGLSLNAIAAAPVPAA
jgi:DNA-binding transcriptional ArsR family regulator